MRARELKQYGNQESGNKQVIAPHAGA